MPLTNMDRRWLTESIMGLHDRLRAFPSLVDSIEAITKAEARDGKVDPLLADLIKTRKALEPFIMDSAKEVQVAAKHCREMLE